MWKSLESISFSSILYHNNKRNYKRKSYGWNKWRLFLRNCNYPWFLIYSDLPQQVINLTKVSLMVSVHKELAIILLMRSKPPSTLFLSSGLGAALLVSRLVSSENQCFKKIYSIVHARIISPSVLNKRLPYKNINAQLEKPYDEYIYSSVKWCFQKILEFI